MVYFLLGSLLLMFNELCGYSLCACACSYPSFIYDALNTGFFFFSFEKQTDLKIWLL